MPIYAYKCAACGFAEDVMQKMADAELHVCPQCSQDTFSKQLTAAGFQLKGSGYYATDFKQSGSAPAAAADGDSGTTAPACGTGACPACA
ncbi:MAG TPA: FmdB family zinc ribbon protein [Burkholderiales bacterium]|nr:FmdB family zinc ribbon protein [Burkholderiales bacterium]